MVIMLRQCCCGCSLKTGTIILGALDILGSLGFLYDGITAAISSDSVKTGSRNESVAVGVVLALFGAILLLVSICLIIGALKGNPALLVPWLVYTIVFMIAFTVLYIVMATKFFAAGDAALGAGYIITAVIYDLLGTYFLLVVYSLYRELKGTAPANNA